MRESPESKFLSPQHAKFTTSKEISMNIEDLQTVLVIGAGTLGGQIALQSARYGF
jgi:hypothetical protein